LQSFAVCRFRKIQNDLDIVPEGSNTGGGDVVAQEIQFGEGGYALLQIRASPLKARKANNVRRWAQCCFLDLLYTLS
jgi:hypothetical protein